MWCDCSCELTVLLFLSLHFPLLTSYESALISACSRLLVIFTNMLQTLVLLNIPLLCRNQEIDGGSRLQGGLFYIQAKKDPNNPQWAQNEISLGYLLIIWSLADFNVWCIVSHYLVKVKIKRSVWLGCHGRFSVSRLFCSCSVFIAWPKAVVNQLQASAAAERTLAFTS